MAKLSTQDNYQLALKYFLMTGKPEQAYKKLIQDGYCMARSTFYKLYGDNEATWKGERESYVIEFAKEQAQLVDLESKTLVRLTGLVDKVFEQLEAVKEDFNPQDIYPLMRSIEGMLKLNRKRADNKVEDNKEIDVFVDVMFEHPEIGPLLRQDLDRIRGEVEKRLNK